MAATSIRIGLAPVARLGARRASPAKVLNVASNRRGKTKVLGASVRWASSRRARVVVRSAQDDDELAAWDPSMPLPPEDGMGLSEAEVTTLLSSADENVLTTALSRAIAVEDFGLAAKLSARLKEIQGVGDCAAAEILDWRAMGMAEWLCDRAESLGYRFPTAIQRRSSLAFFKKRDVVIQAQTGSGKTLAYLMPTVDNMDFVARRMLQILIIVPSRELTIQTVMLAFRLLGGNVNAGVPGDPGNMYNYKGPQGLKVVGVFEEEHVLWEGFADVAEIVVGTPDLLVRMKQAGKLEVDLAQTIIADEADQLFEQFPDAMDALLEPSPYAPVMEDRQIVLCGVNVPSWVVDSGVRKGYLRSPLEVSMGTPGRVPPDVSHRRLVVPRVRKLVALARQIRADLKNAGEDAPPPRTIVFVPSAAAAEAAAVPLRKSLWGQHKLAVLLPEGEEAVRTMQDFKNQKTTLLLCTPDVERGLDMPGVDYVYSLDAPGSTASYLHRSGRCGRLGAVSKGTVTSVVTPEETPSLDQTYLDLEINAVESLEEQSNDPALGRLQDEARADVNSEGYGDGAEEEEALVGTGEAGGGAGAQEEQALTAEALNDLFYLLDAQAEAVNALEAAFSMDPAVSEDEDDAEDDERSENMQKAIEDIRKIFDVDDIPEEDIPDDFKPPDAQW